MKPNLNDTRKFFSIISSTPEFQETLQVFKDAESARFDFGKLNYFDSTTYSKQGAITINRKMSAHVSIKGNADLIKDLATLQAQGYGVYYMTQMPQPKPTDQAGNCRTAANVAGIRTLFLDLDGAPLAPILELQSCKPHIIIETSPGKFHCYWKVAACEMEEHKYYQKALALRFSGDPSVHDLARVARVPGFYNLKSTLAKPFLVQVYQVNQGQAYQVKALAQALKLQPFMQQVKASLVDPSQLTSLIPKGERHNVMMGYARKFAAQGKSLNEIELLLAGLASKMEDGHEFQPGNKSFPELQAMARSALTYQVQEQVSQIQELVAVASAEVPAILCTTTAEELKAAIESEPTAEGIEAKAEAPEAITYETKDHVICANQLLSTFFEEHHFLWWQEQLYTYDKKGYWKAIEIAPLRRILRNIIHASSSKPIPETFFENVIKVVKDHLLLPISFQPDNWINSKPGQYLNLENGILNIDTMELVPHSRDFFSIGQLPYNYDPTATAPSFEAWQQELFDHYEPDQAAELRLAIVRYMAYCLVPNTDQQKFLLLMGASRGGKGMLCKTFEALLGGDNVASLSLASLASAHGLTQIPGAKVVLVAETPPQIHHFQLASVVEVIKRLAAGDDLVINPKGQKEFKHRPTAKFIMASEFALPFKDAGGGLLKRAVVIPFEKSYAGKEDPHFFTRIAGELSGILNLALAQLPYLRTQGLLMPQVSRDERDDYQASINPIAHFIDTKFERTDNKADRISNKTLFELYQRCVDAHEYPPIERQSFFKQLGSVMRGRYLSSRNKFERGYQGIKSTDLLTGIEFDTCPF